MRMRREHQLTTSGKLQALPMARRHCQTAFRIETELCSALKHPESPFRAENCT